MAQRDLGNIISELRKKAGMTQQDLADKLNITDKAISKWERGLSSPDIDTIPRIAQIFGVTSEELLNAKLKEEEPELMSYKYEYVDVKIDKLFGAKSSEHREIIDQYAKKGYRYIGFLPTDIAESGKIKKVDLIFEKQYD
jgi:transcriptional regulator with XRE-family HTH domain